MVKITKEQKSTCLILATTKKTFLQSMMMTKVKKNQNYPCFFVHPTKRRIDWKGLGRWRSLLIYDFDICHLGRKPLNTEAEPPEYYKKVCWCYFECYFLDELEFLEIIFTIVTNAITSSHSNSWSSSKVFFWMDYDCHETSFTVFADLYKITTLVSALQSTGLSLLKVIFWMNYDYPKIFFIHFCRCHNFEEIMRKCNWNNNSS